jgi:O-antigen/teichoic acid export membrane protein
VLLSVFVGSFALLDLGLGFSFVKFVAQFRSSGDFTRINGVLSTGLIFYAAFGALILTLGILLEPLLFQAFRIGTVPTAYVLVLGAFAVGNFGGLLLSVLRGLQRMDQSNMVEMVMAVPHVVGTVLVLESGMGITGLALNALVVSILTVFTAAWRLRLVEPRVRLDTALDRPLARQLFAYGVRLQVGRLGALICFQVDKLIISRFLGVASVSFYEVSSRLTLFMRALPLVMISALIPTVSELEARGEKAQVLKTYFLAARYIVIVTVGLVAFVILEAGSLLFLWLGPGFEQSVVLVQVLAIGYGVNAISESATQTGSGVGRPDIDMRGAILLTVLNPLLSLALVTRLGAPGAALGTTIALLSSAVFVVWTFHRVYAGTPVLTLVGEVHVRPWTAAILGASGIGLFHRLLPLLADADPTRLLAGAKIAVDGCIFASVYLLVLVALRHVTTMDLQNLSRLAAVGYRSLRGPFPAQGTARNRPAPAGRP